MPSPGGPRHCRLLASTALVHARQCTATRVQSLAFFLLWWSSSITLTSVLLVLLYHFRGERGHVCVCVCVRVSVVSSFALLSAVVLQCSPRISRSLVCVCVCVCVRHWSRRSGHLLRLTSFLLRFSVPNIV